MIIGAQKETDLQIIKTSENIYRNFKVKRVYYSTYVPVLKSPILPDLYTAPPLAREHRLYQADWLLRFYGFSAQELVDEAHPNLDADMDPKSAWALRHPEIFPMEVNTVSMDQLLRIPGIGTLSALRIVKQRRHHSVGYEDLKKMGVVLKRAKFFLTCKGKYLGGNHLTPEKIREEILRESDGVQISLFNHGQQTPFLREKP